MRPRPRPTPQRWASDPTPPKALYAVPLLAAWTRGHRRYYAGWPLRLVPRAA